MLLAAVGTAVAALETTSRSMSANAAETSDQAASVTCAAQEASGGVQTVSAAAEQLSGSIGEIGRQVAQSAAVSNQAVAQARRTDEIVQALSRGAAAIENVVGLITVIAGQTNLLALNATIEEVSAVAVEQQGAATAEIARNVQHTAANTNTVTGSIGLVSRAAQGTGVAAAAVLEAAGNMSCQAAELAGELDRFVATVRIV